LGQIWAIKKELDYDITLHPKFLSHGYMPYSCYHTFFYDFAIILMHTKLNAPKSSMPPLIAFFPGI
jgi:hypothetical protein